MFLFNIFYIFFYFNILKNNYLNLTFKFSYLNTTKIIGHI